ncbi:MAG: 30S ribosomal protein S8 [bacterium]|nr:30S ribosomal protein S8 [bacterium]
MTMTDPISDLLTRIRNALMVNHDQLTVPGSNLKLEVCRILKEQGYIEEYTEEGDDPISRQIRIILKYGDDGAPAIRRMQRVSKPGRRVYCGADDLKPALNGLGVGIVSTSKGLLTDSQARDQRVGGEVLCEIW